MIIEFFLFLACVTGASISFLVGALLSVWLEKRKGIQDV